MRVIRIHLHKSWNFILRAFTASSQHAGHLVGLWLHGFLDLWPLILLSAENAPLIYHYFTVRPFLIHVFLLFPMAIRRASSRQCRYASKSLAPLSLSSSCMEYVQSGDMTTMRKAQKLRKRRGAIGELRWSLSLLATCLDKISIMTAFARELPPLLLFSTVASWASETGWTSSRARRWYSPLLL